MNTESLSNALTDIADRHIAEAAEVRTRKAPRLRRVLVAAAAAVLCVVLALPVLAASEGTYELLYTVAPSLAQRFKPVQMSCEDNGIVMEVVAASVEEDTAEACIALRDLTGDRVDETTDLFDSWDFHTPFDCSGTCRLDSFDPDTRTALFYVLLQTMDGKEIRPEDGKITFSVGEFLSHKQILEGVELPGVLENCAENPKTAAQWLRGGGGPGYSSEPSVLCLVPLAEPLCVPADGVAVTGAGYVDGLLHIQVRYEDILHTDNHGFLCLRDAEGDTADCLFSLSFFAEDGVSSYEDYVFDVPEDTLDGFALSGDFWTCSGLTEGSWQVTFPLEEN